MFSKRKKIVLLFWQFQKCKTKMVIHLPKRIKCKHALEKLRYLPPKTFTDRVHWWKNLNHLCSVKVTMVKANHCQICFHNCQDKVCKTDTQSERSSFHNCYNQYYRNMKISFTCSFISLTSCIFYKNTATMSQVRHKSHSASHTQNLLT